jgi:DNA-binding beta-propeller fold protein YncE
MDLPMVGARGAGLIYNQALSNVRIGGIVGEVLQLLDVQSAGMRKRRGMERTVRGATPLGRAAAAGLAAWVAMIAGCGNAYRPVVSAIGVVGPAAQPPKYAIAVSSPTKIPMSGPLAFVGAWSPTTTYSINQGVGYLGAQYVSLQNANIGQNPSTATAYWSQLSNGLLTMVDFSGDTVLVTAPMGLNPYYLALDSSGFNAYTLNSDTTVTSWGITPSYIPGSVDYTTLLAGANPVSIFPTTSLTYIADPGVNAVDQLLGSPPALKQELPVATAYTPVYVVGQSTSSRFYAISTATNGGPGQVEAIENAISLVTTPTISATLPVGRGPVYGVMTLDDRRAFILNQTDGTVTVINAQTNALDTPVSTIAVGVRPVWADLASALDELVVVNEGTGTSQGSVTLINIPLCSATALPTNPNCDPTNPIDATTFGQVVTTVPVGVNPIMVSVLSDYSRAYVANAGNLSLPCGTGAAGSGTTLCSVSVVNLTTNTVTATIPIDGHPAYIATSNSTPTGKVYVVCNDSQVMTVIETDTDTVDTTIPLQGYGVSVRVTKP